MVEGSEARHRRLVCRGGRAKREMGEEEEEGRTQEVSRRGEQGEGRVKALSNAT